MNWTNRSLSWLRGLGDEQAVEAVNNPDFRTELVKLLKKHNQADIVIDVDQDGETVRLYPTVKDFLRQAYGVTQTTPGRRVGKYPKELYDFVMPLFEERKTNAQVLATLMEHPQWGQYIRTLGQVKGLRKEAKGRSSASARSGAQDYYPDDADSEV